MYKQPTIYKTGNIYKLDGGAVAPDNFEVPKSLAIVGDEVYADSNGAVHFIRTSTLDTDTIPAGWEYVGPVAIREGDKAIIIHKPENTSERWVRWASMWLFKVEGLKLDGTDTFVLQQGPATGSTPVDIGTFTATAAAIDIDTLVSELDTWLRANPTAAGALENYNWHAEKHEDADGVDSCFIVVDNIHSRSRISPIKSSASGASSILYMWEWCGFNSDVYSIARKDGVSTFAVVANKERFKQYDTDVNSPTDSLTTTGLFNEAGFNATTVVKGYYGTYENYLENMLPSEEATSGAYFVYKDKGKEVSTIETEVSFPNLSGTDTNVFAASAWAKSLKAHSTASVEGMNEGDFFIPSINTMFKIISMMKTDGSDILNSAIRKAGSTPYELDRYRGLPARSSSSGEWIIHANGYFYQGYMDSLYREFAVAEIDL